MALLSSASMSVGAARVIERNVFIYRRVWLLLLSGFFEPLFYLFSIGFGLGSMVGTVDGIPYAAFVAPAMLATSAMNGALYDSLNLFDKLRYARTYDALLVTPLSVRDIAGGEIGWAIARGMIYSAGFLVVMVIMGLVSSPWALLAVPASLFIAFAAAGVGSAVTTYVRRWSDFDLVIVATVPLFLLSGTFFPVTDYPAPLRLLAELSPLYRGVHLIRALCTGAVDPLLLVDVAYLTAFGVAGLWVTSRRLGAILLR
jgi:lipooligosaccharide transport system permease protein